MRHVIFAGLALSLIASGAMAQGTAGPKAARAAKAAKAADVTKPVVSDDAQKNKAQLLAERRQREWDRKSAVAMKSICSNC